MGTEILEAYILTKFGRIFTLWHCCDTFPLPNFNFLLSSLKVLKILNEIFFIFEW